MKSVRLTNSIREGIIKQLKDQFPEAYKIFLELNNEVEDNSDNLCDSFENIRASLSKFNKK